MNNRGGGPPPGSEQSPLSLLVNAADSHDPRDPRLQREIGGPLPGRSLTDTLRLRGLAAEAGAASLEEQLLLQQHAQALGQQGLLSQIRDQNLLAQLGQQQQLASLLSLGGGSDVRSALAAAQLRQQQVQLPQISQAELLGLGRSSGLSGLAGILGGGGAAGLAELEGLQRLEELERRQRLLAAASGSPLGSSSLPRVDVGAESKGFALPPSLDRLHSGDQLLAEVSSPPSSPVKIEKRHSDIPLSGAAESSFHKEEVEKTPGSVIVPCRARGMPMDHNFKTAYFVIPENVRHGEELICSYFACRNAGIKFRYCSHCKVPVAKRNFRKRHKHGSEIAAGEDSGGEEEEEVPHKKGIPSQIMANREESEEADALSSQTTDSAQHKDDDEKPVSAVDVKKGLVDSSMRTLEEHGRTHGALTARAGDQEISAERKHRWAELLIKRPSTKDGESMSNWLMEVLAISDLDTPLVSESDAPPPAKDDAGLSSNRVVGMPGNFGASGVIVKKKRGPDFLSKSSEEGGSGQYAGGSFAAWKERKKQRKLPTYPNGGAVQPEEEDV